MPGKAALVIEPRFRLHRGRQLLFGPGKAELLERIAQTGSIREAAKAMGMSYMRAWTLMKAADRDWKEPLVRKVRGGRTGGGATLTETGRAVLRLYRDLETGTAAATDAARHRFAALQKR